MSHKLANPAGTGSGVGEGAGRRFGAAVLGSGVGSDRAFFLLRIRLHRRSDPVRPRQILRPAHELGQRPGTVDRCDPAGNRTSGHVRVGIIEIVAGIVVCVAPKFGSLLVVAWLAGIIVNLLSMGEFFDIALRDFGRLVAALALAALAFHRPRKVKVASTAD